MNRIAATLLLVWGLVACSKYSLDLDTGQVDGPGTLGISVSGEPVKGVVIYFHGSDQDAQVIEDDQKHTDLFDPLLRAGYAVVAANAGGNAFGNPESVDAYRRLVAAARKKYVAQSTFFVAESMGAIPALALIAQDLEHTIAGMVGISPLMGLPPDLRDVPFVKGPWGGSVPADADPLAWPSETFEGRSFLMFASKDDKVIPGNASATVFADRYGSVAKVEVVDCRGGHVATACYDGEAVKNWLASLK
jgi:hypothetical protein